MRVSQSRIIGTETGNGVARPFKNRAQALLIDEANVCFLVGIGIILLFVHKARPAGGAWVYEQFSEIPMAVQQNRKTPSKRGMRRSHDALSKPTLSEDSTTGEIHRRHHMTADGFYRGRKIVDKATD